MSFLKVSRFALFCLGLPLVAGSVPGIENFDKVSDHVYRGAQPTNEGFQFLAKSGVKTVIDLRERDRRSEAEERTVTASGMRYLNVPMTGLTPPSPAEIAKILDVLDESNSGPVFVHCKRGADRTGAVIAAYRIHHDHWQNGQALTEAMAHRMSMFQIPRQNFIRTFGVGQDAKVLAVASSQPAMAAAAASTE